MIKVGGREHIAVLIVVKATYCGALCTHVDAAVTVTRVVPDVLFVVDEGLQDDQCALEQLEELLRVSCQVPLPSLSKFNKVNKLKYCVK